MTRPQTQPHWGDHIQKLRLATFGRGVKLVGFASPIAGAGVSTICYALAAATAASGIKTLLVDLSQGESLLASPKAPEWLPGGGGALVAVSRNTSRFDILQAQPTPAARQLFTNAVQLRRTLSDELGGYDAVIVDIAPVWTGGRDSIDAAAAAAACGKIYLVCPAGVVTKTQFVDTVERLQAAGVEILGLIVNDAENPSLGSELAREVRRLSRFMPRFCNALENMLISNVFLNR